MAAVSRGTSHATSKQCCQYTTLVDIKNTHNKKDTVTHSESHVTRVHWVCSRAENSPIWKWWTLLLLQIKWYKTRTGIDVIMWALWIIMIVVIADEVVVKQNSTDLVLWGWWVKVVKQKKRWRDTGHVLRETEHEMKRQWSGLVRSVGYSRCWWMTVKKEQAAGRHCLVSWDLQVLATDDYYSFSESDGS